MSSNDIKETGPSPPKRDYNGIPKVAERRSGYQENGKKKRILLNAFDMNGLGHVR